jgi:Uma2 family endonuclease
MQIDFKQLMVPPGHQVLLQNIDWPTFEEILEETGEHRAVRYAYSQGMLEMMSPLAAHEDDKTIIGNIIEILLEELDIEFRALGSTTLKNPASGQGIEPDECFYIQQEAMVRGKDRLDLSRDPPPDLALEIDLTSRTHFRHYVSLGIPELWRYDGQCLEILLLQDGTYNASESSRQFPDFPLKTLVPALLQQSKKEGRNKTLKVFRQSVRELISLRQKSQLS